MTAISEQIQIDRPNIIDETVDDEVVVVDLQRGSYYSIRGAGVEIWQALVDPTTPKGVTERMAKRFGCPESEISATVESFVSELQSHDLLRESDAASERIAAEPATPHSDTFQAPILEKFTDMEDLLLLDPVHEVDERGWPHAAAAE